MWLVRVASEISWEYIFDDSCRGTELRISTDDKYFQFVTPDKTFLIKHDPDMKIRDQLIAINFEDDEIRLRASAIDNNWDFGIAYAIDKETGKRYTLIDLLDWR